MKSRQKEVPGEGSSFDPVREAFVVLGRPELFHTYYGRELIDYVTLLIRQPAYLEHIYGGYASRALGEFLGGFLTGRDYSLSCSQDILDELRKLACPEWYQEELDAKSEEARNEEARNEVILREEANQRTAREEQRAELRREMEELQEKLDSLAAQVKNWQ